MYKRFAFLALALALVVGGAWAQRVTGSISGMVLDPQGSAVPAAKVTVLNAGTGAKYELESNSTGQFVVPDLPPASYKVTVIRDGFKTYETTIIVRVGVTSVVDAKLQLGATSSVVMVESSAIAADTTKATVQGTVDSTRIESLPLNGRNFLDLAQQEPGVQIVDGGTFDPTKNQFAGVSVGGRSGRVTRIQVDGVDITDETVGTTVANISNESIQEFGIQQSSLDVSTDVTSSGAVNIITRSGSNQFHGSGFGFFRNAKWASDLRLDKTSPSTAEPPFDREQVGGRASGPFVKDRLFWAVDFEYNNQDGQQFTNIPQFTQFTGAFGVPLDERLASGRLDWNVTNNLRGFYRFQHNYNNAVTGFGANDLSAFANLNNTNIHVIGADYTRGRWTHSGRFSYVNFNNFIVDANAAAGTPTTLDPAGNPILIRITNFLTVGPDVLAPQSTFQDNHQSKYDASYVWGKHTFSLGAEHNRIDQFVYANFFGLAPRISASYNAGTQAFAATSPFGPGGITNPLNFPLNNVRVGNGLGYFSEKPALGYPFGGTTNHRLAFYLADSWKVTPNFSLSYGVRYSWHSNIDNSDLERAPLIGVFDPTLVGKPHRDANNFGPQIGFAWNVFGDGKTVIRGGAGIYYETNLFNSILFDRVVNIPAGIGNSRPNITSGSPLVLDPGTGATLFNFTTNCTGLPGNSCFGAPLGAVITFTQQAQALFQAAAGALAAGYPQPGIPPLFNTSLSAAGSLIDPNYKTPYGAQMNIGVQRELRPGLVLSVDYTRNRGVHFNQTRDRNRLGAANSLNVPAAQVVVANTLTACGAATVTAALVSCPNFAGARAVRLSDFVGRGLGAGSGVDGEVFSGQNRNFRDMGIIEPIGLSLYQGLQMRLTGKMGTWGWFRNINTNLTYSLSRFESTGVDQDFLSGSAFNDRPTAFYGPAGLDRTSQVGLTFTWDMPGNFRVSTTNAIRSALPSSLFLPLTSGGADEIFYSDLDGDGVTQDPLPGTNRGSFSRGVSAAGLATMIANYNSSVAGTLAPAAQALVQSGLFTSAQLTQMGAVITAIAPPPAGQVNNDSFFTTDVRFSWRYKVTERVTVEPMLEVFNLFNVANYAVLSNTLDGGAGDPNGTIASTRTARVGLGSGSFSSGIPRAAQFGFRVSF